MDYLEEGVPKKNFLWQNVMNNKIRCFGDGDELYSNYHDNEWGILKNDDKHLFELLILEGAQAGLSWITVLRKREEYRKVFFNFDVDVVSCLEDDYLLSLMNNKGIIRNKLKIFSVKKNAKVFIEAQKEFGSFYNYLMNFVGGKQIINNFDDMPVNNELSDLISKDLKKRGMSFVGSTIIYSYLQASGVIVDHVNSCFLSKNYK